MSTVRWGIVSTAEHRAWRRSSRACDGRPTPRCSPSRRASPDGAEATAAALGIPRAYGIVRGAARGPRRGRRVHPAAQPPARRVDDRRGAGRQARPVREAARDDGRRGPGDGRRAVATPGCCSWRRSCTASTRRGPPCASSSRPGGIGRLRAVDSWFSYYNDDPANIRNIAAAGGGALFDIGCYSVNLSRMLFGAEPDDVQGHGHPRP